MKVSMIITWIIIAVSIISFYEGNPFFGVIFLLWASDRLFAYREPIDERLSLSEWENRAKVYLAFDVIIPEILKHSSIDKIYESRKKAGLAKENTKDEWLKNLTENYERQYKQPSGISSVKFQINGNQLFKNGVVDFSDHLYHEVSIPYSDEEGKDAFDSWSDTSRCITIRIFAVNGFLQLQVGRFAKEDSPNVSSHGFGSGTYEEYAIITQFPLMYCSSTLPPKYLNLAFAASDYYKERHMKRTSKSRPINDWREINTEVHKYIELWKYPNDLISGKGMKLLSEFHKKREAHLEKNAFIKDEYSEYYRNNYLNVLLPEHDDDGIGKFYSNWTESEI